MAQTIARIKIEGVIEKENETYNQKWLLENLERLCDDKRNEALILYIDSPGGSVYEADEVYSAVKKYKEKTKRPVYAYFASLAASGGYYIACAADKIIANRNTLTGSIGVIAGRFVDLTEPMKKYGIKAETIHAGRNKTMGSFTEPVTQEQRDIMQSIADECYAQFTGLVAESRHLDLEKVKELADGRIYTASQAKTLGLVDEIADFERAVEILKEKEFGDKEYKAEIRKLEVKQKRSLKKLLRGASSLFGGKGLYSGAEGILAEEILGSSALHVQFPAFIYEGNLR